MLKIDCHCILGLLLQFYLLKLTCNIYNSEPWEIINNLYFQI